MASFAMLFGTLLMSYLLIRSRQVNWPPIGVEPLSPMMPALSTLVLLISSGLFHASCTRLKTQKIAEAKMFWRIGTYLGAVFMVLQFFICWQWRIEGLVAGESLFASIIYTLIGVHFFHALASWLSLIWVYFKSKFWSGTSEAPSVSEAPLITTWFWHFLDAVWIVTFVLIFVG